MKQRDDKDPCIAIRDRAGDLQGFVDPFTGSFYAAEKPAAAKAETAPHLRWATAKTKADLKQSGKWRGK